MSEKVVFSQLSRKFIDENDATPAEAQQVVYYSLAIGHHLGVIDCLEAALTCPWDEYLAWIATLEAGSEALTIWVGPGGGGRRSPPQNGRRAEIW